MSAEVRAAAKGFPVVVVTGPRRSGKTTLLRMVAPKASYHLLEDPDLLARVRADPRAFLESVALPAILDEVQNAPELLAYVRSQVDAAPKKRGRWFLSGSQEAPPMQGVTESLAGRAAIFHLLPLSLGESPRVSLWRGGFPEVLAQPKLADTWFRSYIQTYLERDVRAVTQIRDLSTFRRFLSLVASRAGSVLNKTDLAAPLGVSVPTIAQWLSVLEITGQILLVPPFYENFGKRLGKSPKLYFADTGLLCHLLGLRSEAELERSPFLGPVFESFVASEIAKRQLGAGRAKELYHFRDAQGLEVDFIVPRGGGRLLLLQAKASRTAKPEMAEPLLRLSKNTGQHEVERVVVHRPVRAQRSLAVLAPGVSASTLEHVVRDLVLG